MRVRHKVRVRTMVPKRQRQDPHQRTVAVVVLIGRTRTGSRNARAHGANSLSRAHADIKYQAIDCHITMVVPLDKAIAQVLDVEAILLQQ